MSSPLLGRQVQSARRLTRLRAAGWHLLGSGLVILPVACLVFLLWYPSAFRLMSGGQSLFSLLVAVDIALGPLLTFVVFDRRKCANELRRDIAVIVTLQAAALAYGLHTVSLARPIALVFEKDRFRVISAAEVYEPELPQAPTRYQRLPYLGPWLLGARDPVIGPEGNDAVFMAIDRGIDLSQRPKFWLPYEQSRARAAAVAEPVSRLIERYPSGATSLKDKLEASALSVEQARFLPVQARGDWVALLRPDGEVVGFAPFDGF
jgi:hypothetical protein